MASELPTLVVRAGDGSLPRAEAEAMADQGRHANVVELADAKHAEWRKAVSEFLDSLEARPAGFEPATSRSGGERSIH
jgi:hypothetical protein